MHRTLASVGFLTLLVLVGLPSVLADTVVLSFDERVRAQEAIERVYHAHRVGDTRSFEEATPKSRIEQKVNRYLAQSVAIEAIWDTPVTTSVIERELERIAHGTRLPERLQELFDALANDPLLVRECLVRPVLVDRMARQLFSRDRRIHADTRPECSTDP